MRPWFRMYRREAGSFAQLPFAARAAFREILTLTDDAGVISIGTKEPAEAVAFALGADRADRRMLNRVMPLLLADGCLVRDGQTLRAPNFQRFQSDKMNQSPTTPEPVTDQSGATLVQLSCNSQASKNEVSARNDTVARNVLSSEREEIEKKRESIRTRLVKGFQRRWEAARKAAWPGPKGDPEWERAAKFIAETAQMRGVTPDSLATEALDAWFRDEWVIASKHPDTNFPRHIAKHIAPPEASDAGLSPLESAFVNAQKAAQEAVQRGADAQTQFDLDQAEEAARRALAASRRAS